MFWQIYSHDANLIVSLLDLHPTRGENLEIFEAGTGHGALTLHLARAIHAANPPHTTLGHNEVSKGGTLGTVLEEFGKLSLRSSRKAVIHTLDISAGNSEHARKTVKNFRGGVYLPNIEFHVSTIDAYLNARIADAQSPFLDHAILDLPATHEHLEIVAKSMKANGKLITFCPSITQINASVLYVKENKISFFLENVIEVGGAVGVGGREWDVRPVLPRRFKLDEPTDVEGVDGDGLRVESVPDSRWEIICRPKVGVRVVGGGFVGVWRRIVES
jgi:tRNA (adenine57-N1/adenine58-N1)-methyltransferase catalytic subunit